MKIDKRLRRIVTFNHNMQWLFIGVVLVFILNASLFFFLKNDSGTFGDQFGAANALFSGFAFAGLIVTILLQRRDLRLQRKDLKMQRKELQITNQQLEGQKEELEEQNKTLRIQRFENTFFHMMELQQQIVNDLYAKESEDKTVQEQTSTGVTYRGIVVEHNFQGRNLFTHKFAHSIHEVYVNDYHKVKVWGFGGVMEKKGFSQYELYNTPTLFDHYFRHLYTILKFIDKEDIQETDKRIFSDEDLYGYAKILRATLSRYELVWLYYNGLSSYGNKKLKPLLEKYCMLKNLREELLVCCKENQDAFKKIGLTPEQVRTDKFTGTDYEFFLTSEKNDKKKYHYSAFYKSLEEQTKSIKLINDWNAYLDDKKKYAAPNT